MVNNRYLKITICDQSRIVFNSIIKKIKTISGIDVLDVEHMSKKVIKSGTDEVPVEYCYTEITNENVNTENSEKTSTESKTETKKQAEKPTRIPQAGMNVVGNVISILVATSVVILVIAFVKAKRK